jgi:hypothetical protein
VAENAAEPQDTTTAETVTEATAETVAEDLSTLTDADVEAVITEATDAANAATEAEVFDNDVFEAALARANAATAELNARTERRNQLASARSRAAELSALRPTPVAATVVPRVAEIARTAPVQNVTDSAPVSFSFHLPADGHGLINGRVPGDAYTSFSEVGVALDSRSRSVGNLKNGRADFGLMQIQRNDTKFTASRDDVRASTVAIDAARDQKRLSGGNILRAWENGLMEKAGGEAKRISLTAAAGWCAPSETLYDLCEMESLAGLIDLPEITVSRGGVRWTQEPTYPQLDAATTFTSLTEAQVIADVGKVCSEIPCPTFTDTRLNIAATCLTGSFLQLRGYPELIQRWVRGSLVVHAHKLNEIIIDALVATAGAAIAITAPAGDPATSAVLSAVELAATDIRHRHMLSDDAVIEIVLPDWILPVIRADFTRRNAGDPGLTDARIMDWFVIRHVRPQFVRDWQDFYGGVAAPSVGGPAPFITAFPTTVNFLAFPAGGVVLAREDVITLRNVYDSTNLQQNLYTELFFEEGWAPIYPCPEIRQYSALACPSGATAAQIDLDCTEV